MRGFCIMISTVLWLLFHEIPEDTITPMRALDIVKGRYAANFDKITEGSEDKYYYKLANANLYLCFEEEVGEDGDYIIHLYEFVEDIPETGLGHTVTYGWYTVDRESGEIIAKEYE